MTSQELKGFLNKQGAKGIVKGWKKRWFALKGSQLHYYKAADEAQSLGYIELNQITGVRETPNTAERKSKGEFLFEIYTPTRVYNLMANSENVMKYWIDGISNVSGAQHKTPPAPRTTSFAPSKLPEISTEPQEEARVSVHVNYLSENLQKLNNEAYCVLAIENQQMKTKTVKNGIWRETFYLDVSDLQFSFVVNVWISTNLANPLGRLSIPLTTLKKEFDSERETSFPLSSVHPGESSPGQIVLRIQYTLNSRRVGEKDFDLLKVLGKGNFGKVMMVKKKDTDRIYAMKVLKKASIIAADAVRHTLSETNVLRRVRHPFIVSLRFAFQTEDKLYMILDYLNGGELFFHLSNVDRFSEERACFYGAEITSALGYLHSMNVIYRDLKPENLLLNMDGHVCLTDFGLVKENLAYGEETHTFCGSPEYLAPEILQGKGYGRGVDWWALGTLIYEMMEGLPPFYDEDHDQMNQRILRQPLYFDPSHFSPASISILEALLQRDPRRRLGTGPTDFKELTVHPFFKGINWDDLYQRKVEPLFKPHIPSSTDSTYFDPEFTNQIARHSIVNEKISRANQRAFDGFSYVPPSSESLAAKRKSMRASQGPAHWKPMENA